MDAGEAYERLVEHFVGAGKAAAPGGRTGFGAGALKVDGSIFAMLTRGQLVVKLPRDRVAQLVADGAGEAFTAGKGTPMKEWVALVGVEPETWRALAEEAYAFVSR